MGKLFALTLLLAMGAASPAALAAGVPPDGVVQTVASVSRAERPSDAEAMLAELNAARARLGLPLLAPDPRLDWLAQEHAADMIVRHYFAHETPEGASPFERMRRAGYSYAWAGENLAIDTDADSACRDLLASEGHRANILNPHFRRVGIAAIPGDDGEYFVQDFSD
ncbi:MAG: CAP domain-containing protein [Candidatus Baltobacteraceae bacterium]